MVDLIFSTIISVHSTYHYKKKLRQKQKLHNCHTLPVKFVLALFFIIADDRNEDNTEQKKRKWKRRSLVYNENKTARQKVFYEKKRRMEQIVS